MQPRQIGILAVALVVAFGVAFGVGKAASGGGTEPAQASGATAGSGSKALELEAARISVTVDSGVAVPR